jgi:hypothetical protein
MSSWVSQACVPRYKQSLRAVPLLTRSIIAVLSTLEKPDALVAFIGILTNTAKL